MKALIDTCVIIDALQNREPFFDDAQNIIIASANGEYEGYVSAKALLDVYYIIRKYRSDKETRKYVLSIMDLFGVIDTTGEDLLEAVNGPVKDFEDGVMSETAARAGMDIIVTRNIKDYKKAKIKAALPSDFLALLDGGIS